MTVQNFAKKVRAMLTPAENAKLRHMAREGEMGWGRRPEDWGSYDLKKG